MALLFPGVQHPPPQVPNVNTTNQAHQQAMDDMAAVNKAQEEIDAAHAYYALQAKGRRAALDLIDDGRRYRRVLVLVIE
ncbi:hypothetical protein Leryth_019547 [Lithospermum erythrorhizon]|nr:hypothetical protein Leryth_019547 [Lithospermum erythrorhizon]